MGVKRAVGLILAAFGLVCAGRTQGQARVPCDIQYDLAIKILAFDRRLPARVGEELVIGVVYQGDFSASLQVKVEMEQAYSVSPIKKVGTIPVRLIALDLTSSARWEEDIKMAGIDIVYLAPLRGQALPRLVALCRRLRLTSISSLAEYPSRGAAIGFEPSGGKPIIVINLSAARAEGADFSSRLLGMAKVIR